MYYRVKLFQTWKQVKNLANKLACLLEIKLVLL